MAEDTLHVWFYLENIMNNEGEIQIIRGPYFGAKSIHMVIDIHCREFIVRGSCILLMNTFFWNA